ncbi:iron-sulfur cluster biosynthesis family protein [Ornithinibacillus contaminans]|uniref:iron-sulfur cluster biosynthesis family protein n=1 Tax=Ornithinibacillus contaminans TaxID=694055 RepID=UPI00064E137D|nr:iron-sulfur cluster biosynthesis family protein [Ornithinibacillus contaminans]
MKLSITETALLKIHDLNKMKHKFLLLHYDTMGMCAVNGIPTIKLIPEKLSNHLDVDSDRFPTVIPANKAVFFAENMKLDFTNGQFRLSGPEGILNPFIPVTNVVE